ncbi:MAG: hypothetical protein VKP70_04680 [Cyanobacteriota bacterium]|nr:hypothetical protein [Cyanobacteriota bacterium]
MGTEGQSLLAVSASAPGGTRRRGALGLALAAGLVACQGAPRETPQAMAKPGDVLVRSGDWIVTLESPFRQGEPNGLFDGVIRLARTPGGNATLMEINAICSLPGEPGWPSYDNLHGRPIRDVAEAKGRSGDTTWQILFNFSGSQDVRMGEKPGPWVDRLRENLCRRGSFDDRPQKAKTKSKP